MRSRTPEEILADMDLKNKEVVELYSKLIRALRIERLWSDAFDRGLTCTPILVGKFFSSPAPRAPGTAKYPDPYHNVRKVCDTFLRRSDGVCWDLTTPEFMSIFED